MMRKLEWFQEKEEKKYPFTVNVEMKKDVISVSKMHMEDEHEVKNTFLLLCKTNESEYKLNAVFDEEEEKIRESIQTEGYEPTGAFPEWDAVTFEITFSKEQDIIDFIERNVWHVPFGKMKEKENTK